MKETEKRDEEKSAERDSPDDLCGYDDIVRCMRRIGQ